VTLSVGVLLVGQELLDGRRADTNGPWLAARLAEAGARVVGLWTVGDDPARIAEVVAEAGRAADVLVVGGGLGPTADDVTREGLARAAGVGLVPDARARAIVAEGLARHGRALGEAESRQALVPEGSRALENPVGTAPGLVLRLPGTTAYALPGVPRELLAMAEAHVLPALATHGPLDPPAVRRVAAVGRSEPEVGALADHAALATGATYGIYPHEGEIEVVFQARGPARAQVAERAARALEASLGPAFVSPAPVEAAVVAAYAARGLTLATAESMTGGRVAAALTAVPGASAVLVAGWVAYTPQAKTRDLGVPEALLQHAGPVSREVALAMAEGARRRAGADVAIAVTGIAGSDDGTGPGGVRIPRGTFWLARSGPGAAAQAVTRRIDLPRDAVLRRATVAALDLARRALIP
jgi:nicotinamide-nucleotide amidase